jgi:hypothetical protein
VTAVEGLSIQVLIVPAGVAWGNGKLGEQRQRVGIEDDGLTSIRR